MNAHREFVAAACAAVSIDSATSFRWYGRPSVHSIEPDGRNWSAEAARSYLRYALELELYAHAYCPGTPRPAPERPLSSSAERSAGFIAALSSANAGTGSWDPGWEVVGRDDGQLVIRRDGLSLWINESEARASASDETIVSARLPKELRRLSPGFYMALGERGLALDKPPPLVRVYWHVRPRHAAELVGALTRALNGGGIAFRFKVADRPDGYDRCDAGVLYMPAAEYERAQPIVAATYADAGNWLEPEVPGLTKKLAPGLAVAEDPGNGESFGMNRCRLLAEALLRATEQGVDAVASKVQIAAETFAAAGLGIDEPHLNPGATDRYRPFTAVGAHK